MRNIEPTTHEENRGTLYACREPRGARRRGTPNPGKEGRRGNPNAKEREVWEPVSERQGPALTIIMYAVQEGRVEGREVGTSTPRARRGNPKRREQGGETPNAESEPPPREA